MSFVSFVSSERLRTVRSVSKSALVRVGSIRSRAVRPVSHARGWVIRMHIYREFVSHTDHGYREPQSSRSRVTKEIYIQSVSNKLTAEGINKIYVKIYKDM